MIENDQFTFSDHRFGNLNACTPEHDLQILHVIPPFHWAAFLLRSDISPRSQYASPTLWALPLRYSRFHYDSTKLPISTNAHLLRIHYVLGVFTTLPLRFHYALGVLTALPLRFFAFELRSWRFTARTRQPGYKYVTCFSIVFIVKC